MSASNSLEEAADNVDELLDNAVEATVPQWGDDAPRGARAVLSRIIKDGANVPLFLGQTLINSLRDVGYNHTTSAVCEHVDNAIEAEATEIRVYFAEGGPRSRRTFSVVVLDNGKGMAPNVLKVACAFGGSLRFGNRHGIRAVQRGMWLHRTRRKYFECKVLGVPEDKIEKLPNGGWGVRPFAVGVEQLRREDIDDPPDGGWFVGVVRPSKSEIARIEGMSGGPIYGFYHNEDGKACYDIPAVQSSWRPQSRVILGCPLDTFAEVLYQTVEDSVPNVEGSSRGLPGDGHSGASSAGDGCTA